MERVSLSTRPPWHQSLSQVHISRIKRLSQSFVCSYHNSMFSLSFILHDSLFNLCDYVSCLRMHWTNLSPEARGIVGQLAACIVIYPYIPGVRNEMRLYPWDHLCGNEGCLVSQTGMLSLLEQRTGTTNRKWGRMRKRRSEQLCLIYMLQTRLPEAKPSNHLKFLQHQTSIHTHLTSGQMRIKHREQGFCNSYLSPRGHYVALSQLLRTA